MGTEAEKFDITLEENSIPNMFRGTRECQKANNSGCLLYKNDDFHLKQPDILYNSLYITTLKKLHATS